MKTLPNPYDGSTGLADEHSNVLLAAATTATCIDELLTCLFPQLRNNEGYAASSPWFTYTPTTLVGPWDWERTYQYDVRESGTGREQGEVVETVDVFVEAYRRFVRPQQAERKQHEQLCFFIDVALWSILTLQQRIRSVQSVYANATCIVVTGRTGLVLESLLCMDNVVVLHPNEMLAEGSEELPDVWLGTVGTYNGVSIHPSSDDVPAAQEREDAVRLTFAWYDTFDSPLLTGTLDAQGLHFPCDSCYPVLTDEDFAEAVQAIPLPEPFFSWLSSRSG